MRILPLATLLAAGLTLAACGDLNQSQQSTAVGALGGGAVGGVLGSFSGNAGLGALLGAGVGGAAGYLYDQSERQRPAQRGRNNYRRQ